MIRNLVTFGLGALAGAWCVLTLLGNVAPQIPVWKANIGLFMLWLWLAVLLLRPNAEPVPADPIIDGSGEPSSDRDLMWSFFFPAVLAGKYLGMEAALICAIAAGARWLSLAPRLAQAADFLRLGMASLTFAGLFVLRDQPIGGFDRSVTMLCWILGTVFAFGYLIDLRARANRYVDPTGSY